MKRQVKAVRVRVSAYVTLDVRKRLVMLSKTKGISESAVAAEILTAGVS